MRVVTGRYEERGAVHVGVGLLRVRDILARVLKEIEKFTLLFESAPTRPICRVKVAGRHKAQLTILLLYRLTSGNGHKSVGRKIESLRVRMNQSHKKIVGFSISKTKNFPKRLPSQ